MSIKISGLLADSLSSNEMSHRGLSIRSIITELSRTIRSQLVKDHTSAISAITIPGDDCLQIDTSGRVDVGRNKPNLDRINLELVIDILELPKQV